MPSPTPDLFAPPRPAAPAPNLAHEGCGRRGCIAQPIERPAVCFLSEEAFYAHLGDCARQLEAAEVRTMRRWTSFQVQQWLSRVALKRGAAAARRLELALELANQRKEMP